MSGPKYYSDGNGDIQRMFGPVLRYFKCEIGGIDDLLVHSRHLVSENEGILTAFFRRKVVQRNGIHGLFHTYYREAFFPEPAYGINGPVEMLPGHTEFGTYGRLVDLGRRRHGANAAQADASSISTVTI